MLLAQTRDRVQQTDPGDRRSTETVRATCSNVYDAGTNHGERRKKLRLANDVAHGLDVNGMDREESGADAGRHWADEIEQERENECAQRGVERDTGQVKHPRRAAANRPLERVTDRDERTIERRSVLRRSVGKRERPPPLVERVHASVVGNECEIVERKAVRQTGCRRHRGQRDNGDVPRDSLSL